MSKYWVNNNRKKDDPDYVNGVITVFNTCNIVSQAIVREITRFSSMKFVTILNTAFQNAAK